jgi:membrane-associated phospholipid phosphatase
VFRAILFLLILHSGGATVHSVAGQEGVVALPGRPPVLGTELRGGVGESVWASHEPHLSLGFPGTGPDTLPAPPFDLRVAIHARSAGLRESDALGLVARVFDTAAIPGTLLVAGALYGIGERRDDDSLADLGLRTGYAILAAGGATLATKVAIGRARPYAAPLDPHDFSFGRGLRGDRFQSFPSAHTAAAFATATVLAAGLPDDSSGSGAWLSPVFYLGASVAGAARIYYEEHWATDVLAGALLGTLAALPFIQ